MKGRMTRPGLLGLVVASAFAVSATPAAGAKKKPKTRTITKTVTGAFSQCQNLALPITDHSTNRVLFTVPSPQGADPAEGTVTSVTSAAVRLTHTATDDLAIYLVSPGGRIVPLILGRPAGAPDEDLGSGATNCGGNLTTFSDSAATPIGMGTSPFAGSFKPEEPLATFAGGAASGVWTMIVSDLLNADTGTIHAASLNLTFSHTVKQKVKKKKKKKK